MTSNNPLADWLDNPVFVKHVRSRLRAQPLASSVVIVLVLCVCVTWGGFVLDGFRTGGAFGTFLALQTVILAIMGASQVGTSAFSSGLRSVSIFCLLVLCRFHSFAWRSARLISAGFFN
jgi:hypothetical protein